MDFSYLLELAKANEVRNKNDKSVKFSTSVSIPKKESRPEPKGNAIQRAIERKNEKKQKQDDEYQKKKEGLLALRADNKRSKKRVKALINRTKGASKSVLEDAKDITTAIGEEQCDEDDYGYESTMSQQIFSKLQNRYSTIPEDERLKVNKTEKRDMEDIKNRVMNSLKQKHEEDIGVRKRTRRRKKSVEDDDFINDGDSYKKFKDVSSIDRNGNRESENKSHIANNSNKDSHIKKHKKHKHHKSKMAANVNITNYKSDKFSNFKYDKEGTGTTDKKEKIKKKVVASSQVPLSFEQLLKMAQKKQNQPLPVEIKKKLKRSEQDTRPMTALEKFELEEETARKLRRSGKLPPSASNKESNISSAKISDTKDKTSNDKKEKSHISSPVSIKDPSRHFAPPIRTIKTSPSSSGGRNCSSILESKLKDDRKLPTTNSSSNHHPGSSNHHPRSSNHHPRSPDKRRSPPQSFKRRIDSDDEDDSEMDDFIDDGDAEVDYSKEIARMFKYDKNKYRDIDEDVDNMEASYSQMQNEEKVTAKIGLREDLEDIKREEYAKKKKLLTKSKII